METSPDPIRNEVEAIKASWKADPCWDLHEFDAAAADLPHLIPYQVELRQFAIDTRAAWAAEVKAEHDAKIEAIVRRVIDRNNAEAAATGGMPAPPGVVRLARALAAEILELEAKVERALVFAGEAHDRLDSLPRGS